MVAFARPYRRTFLACLMLALGAGAVELTLPVLIRGVIDGCLTPALSAGSDHAALRSRIHLFVALFASAIVVRYLLQVCQGYLLQVAGQSIMRDLRAAIMAKVLSL